MAALVQAPTIGNIGTSSVPILAANVARRYIIIQNISAVNIGVTPGTTAAIGTEGTFTLTPGGSFVFESSTACTNAWQAIAASGASNVITVWYV